MSTNTIRSFFVFALGIFACFIALAYFGQMFYFLETVAEQEVGLQFRNNQLRAVVGPGEYSDFGFSVQLETISTKPIIFNVEDPEIITQDKQRIGLIVTGDVSRPGLNKPELIRENWPRYRDLYTSDDVIIQRIANFTRQAMKVCVGERTLHDAVTGTSRENLEFCINGNIQQQINEIGLRIDNLDVPEIILSPELQAAVDEILECDLEANNPALDQLQAAAEVLAEQAYEKGVEKCD
ncbi:MAG: SPFH domain-containing protein [Chloroflexota bacterium]